MSTIKSFSVGNGDMFYINHNSDNFTVIDCYLKDDRKEEIMDEICELSKGDNIITRFISTHPDEDHFHGIEYFDQRSTIVNFYCVDNAAIKDKDTTSFNFYCKLRDDSKKTYYLYKGCKRKWLNKESDERGRAGINILWPDIDNEDFKSELESANNGGNANNISPIIKYSVQDGVKVLWFGDLEESFMESITAAVELEEVDVVFAPHHGRKSGKLPSTWLDIINPKVIIIGEAASELLEYYKNYNTITQNTAHDVTIECDDKEVHFYSSNKNYERRSYLKNKYKSDIDGGYYIGTLEL